MDDRPPFMPSPQEPRSLGPDSLLWRYFGDWRGMLIGPWAGAMQNLHPAIGAAVQYQSSFFRERWERLLRSVYPINGVVFDGARSASTARQIRDYHRGIHGVDASGRRYSALHPDAFYWAHATFFMGTILVSERLMGGLTLEEKHQLYAEHVQWYALYGMPMRSVPSSWDDFLTYWKRMCVETLEDNPAARGVLDFERLPPPPSLRRCPRWIWHLLWPPFARLQRWLTFGFFDPEIRALFGRAWSRRDAVLHRGICILVRALFACIPRRRRLHPRARSAWDRAAGRIPFDSPLVETPARNLPPIGERGSPHHYSPVQSPGD